MNNDIIWTDEVVRDYSEWLRLKEWEIKSKTLFIRGDYLALIELYKKSRIVANNENVNIIERKKLKLPDQSWD